MTDEGLIMVTVKSLREFSDECLAWASKEDNPCHKQSIIHAALTWKATADAIDRQIQRGAELHGDLRTKLN